MSTRPPTNGPDGDLLDVERAADRLLDRPAPPGYLEGWSRTLAEPVPEEGAAAGSVILFRLGEERFALGVAFVREVHLPRSVRSVPGRSHRVFRGLVCLRGEVHLCADLRALVGVDPGPGGEGTPGTTRMIVVERPGERWALEVDEVLGVRLLAAECVQAPQVTIAKSGAHLSDALLALSDGPAARLDPDRLFAGLARSLA